MRAIREELANAVKTVAPAGVSVLDHLPRTPPTPSVCIGWPEFIDLQAGTLAGQRPVELAVVGVVGLADPRSAQVALDDFFYSAVPRALQDYESELWQYLQAINISNTRVIEDRLCTDLNITLLA